MLVELIKIKGQRSCYLPEAQGYIFMMNQRRERLVQCNAPLYVDFSLLTNHALANHKALQSRGQTTCILVQYQTKACCQHKAPWSFCKYDDNW